MDEVWNCHEQTCREGRLILAYLLEKLGKEVSVEIPEIWLVEHIDNLEIVVERMPNQYAWKIGVRDAIPQRETT